jgi:hypothetical protein
LHRSRICWFLSLLAAGSMWTYVQRALIPREKADAILSQSPRGNLSDLYPRWLGARELLLRGRDPYREDITREIQTGYYGRPIDPTRPNDPKDQQAFAYPLYVVWLLAPTIALPFPLVQTAFLWLLVTVTAISVLLWFRALLWRVSLSSKMIWTILVLGSFPAIQAFKLQQLTLLVSALLAAGMASVVYRRFVLAGILLALATIKPQLTVLMGLWLMVWILGNWRERQRLFWSGTVFMALLFSASEFLLPGWIHEFRTASLEYYEYTGRGRSVLDVALTPVGGRIVSIVLVAVLMIFLWRVRREAERSMAFQWSLAAVLATTLAIIPMFAPYNQILLVPCLILIVKQIRSLWKTNRLSRFFLVITAGSILWPWIAALGMAIALLFLPATTVQRGWPLPLGTTLMIPVCLVALVFVGKRAICSPP